VLQLTAGVRGAVNGLMAKVLARAELIDVLRAYLR
jgi:hypothetical protein